jgi:hypothetical protein
MRKQSFALLLAGACALWAFDGCSSSSSGGGSTDAGPSNGADGSTVSPDSGATPTDGGGSPDGTVTSNDAATGDDGGSQGACATTGYYTVADPATGAASLFLLSKTNTERDVYLGPLHTSDGKPFSGFRAVGSGGVASGKIYGVAFAPAVNDFFVEIDIASQVVTKLGDVPGVIGQTITTLSSTGATGIFAASDPSGALYCVDLNTPANTVGLLQPVYNPNILVRFGGLHGTCATDGTYDLKFVDSIDTNGTQGALIHIQRVNGGGAAAVVSQGDTVNGGFGHGLVENDTATLTPALKIVQYVGDGGIQVVRDLVTADPPCGNPPTPAGVRVGIVE